MEMKRLWIGIMLIILNTFWLFSQNSMDDLNVIFKQDFEHNTLGYYDWDEWNEDFNSPEWNNRQEYLKITQNVSDPVNSSKVLHIDYPANSLSPSEGGCQWWTMFDEQNEIYMSYDFQLMPGFQFALGGKLPSFQAGFVPGDKSTGYDGFTGGLMFNSYGELVFYIYYPDCRKDAYGEAFTWGVSEYPDDYFEPSQVKYEWGIGVPTHLDPGTWHNITYRMVANTVPVEGQGNYDGILEAYFDGILVTQIDHFQFRYTNDLKIDRIRMTTFFGGNTDAWRNPIDEWLKVDNIMLYNFKDHMDVPRGNVLSPTTRTINYWRNFNQCVAPAVNTNDVTEVTNNSAVCGGNVLTDGGNSVTERGICWNTSGNPTISGNKLISGNGTGSYSASITGLEPNTTYHIRAYATNSCRTVYGTEEVFTTGEAEKDLLSDLEEYYKFDGVVFGSNEVGPLTIHSPYNCTQAPAKLGWASVEFNGTNSIMASEDSPNWTIAGSTDLTISAWIYLTGDITSNGYGNIWGHQAGPQFYLKYNSSKKYQIGWYVGNNEVLSDLKTFEFNTWYYVSVVKDGVDVTFYLNGQPVGSGESPDITIDPPQVYIGNDSHSTPEAFRGRIDELGIWKRVLAADEIISLYNNGSGLSYPFGVNRAPIASSVIISGNFDVGEQLTGGYNYFDYDNDLQGNSILQWYKADDINGTNKQTVGSGQSYSITASDISKYIQFEVTPIAQSGILTGNPVASQWFIINDNTQSSLKTDLVAYYQLDETTGVAIDKLTDHNGTVSAGVTRGANGKIEKAFMFDGNGDYVSLASPITLKTASYSFWINITSITDDLIVLGSDPYFARIFIGSNNNLKLETNTNGEEFGFYTGFSTGSWYHIVLTREGDLVKFYRNGSYISSAFISGSDDLTISQIGLNGRSFRGTIDEVGIWSRALLADEVTTLNNQNQGLSYPFTQTKSSIEIGSETKGGTISQYTYYPNPFRNELTFENTNQVTKVEVFNILGINVLSMELSDNQKIIINTENFKNGYYIVRLTDSNGKEDSFKLFRN